MALKSVQFRRSVVSTSLQPHGLQQARPPCPSPAPGALKLTPTTGVLLLAGDAEKLGSFSEPVSTPVTRERQHFSQGSVLRNP